MLLGRERRTITQNSLFIVLSWGRILVLQFCAQVGPGFLCKPLRRPPPDSLEGLSALWSSQFGPESLVGLRGVPRGDGKYSGVLITRFFAVSEACYRKIPSQRGDGESPKSGRRFIPPVLIGR